MALNLAPLASSLTTIATTPGAWSIFTSHLSQSNEVKAVGILSQMTANPANASTLLAAFDTIPNMPADVESLVNSAVTNPDAPNYSFFKAQINQAQATLIKEATTNLGGLFSAL